MYWLIRHFHFRIFVTCQFFMGYRVGSGKLKKHLVFRCLKVMPIYLTFVISRQWLHLENGVIHGKKADFTGWAGKCARRVAFLLIICIVYPLFYTCILVNMAMHKINPNVRSILKVDYHLGVILANPLLGGRGHGPGLSQWK